MFFHKKYTMKEDYCKRQMRLIVGQASRLSIVIASPLLLLAKRSNLMFRDFGNGRSNGIGRGY